MFYHILQALWTGSSWSLSPYCCTVFSLLDYCWPPMDGQRRIFVPTKSMHFGGVL